MRTYLILKERVERFNQDKEIQQLLKELRDRGKFTVPSASALKAQAFDLATMRTQGYAYERLDQLTMELLLGIR
jgi:xylose isomerase